MLGCLFIILVLIVVFCLVYKSNNTKEQFIGTSQKIPKIIHQTLKDKKNIHPDLLKNIKIWKEQNPEYDYRLYDNNDCIKYLTTFFSPQHVETFHNIKVGAGKADFFRYCVVFREGGIYSDIDMYSIKPLSSLINPDDTFIIPKDRGKNINTYLLFQAFFGSTPNNPILGIAIQKVIENVRERRYCNNLFGLSGPSMFGQCVNLFIGRNRFSEFKDDEIIRTKGEQIKILTHDSRFKDEIITFRGIPMIKAQTQGKQWNYNKGEIHWTKLKAC
jgi:hypothetical protein